MMEGAHRAVWVDGQVTAPDTGMPELTVTPADFTTRGDTTRPTSRKEEAHATMPTATCFPPQGTCSRH